MKTFRRVLEGRVGILLAGAFTATVVVLFWAILPAEHRVPESSDFASFYEPVARSIQAGRGPVLADGDVATRYPPGHSAVLACALGFSQLTGISDVRSLKGLIVMCFAATAMLLYMVAREVWGSTRGLLVPVIISTYPFALWLTKEPLSEVTFLVVLSAMVWVFWHAVRNESGIRRKMFVVGMLAGVAMLVRPAGIGLPFVFAFFFVAAVRLGDVRFRVVSSSFIIVGALLTILPWEVHVFSRTGRVIPLSTGGPSSVLDGVTFAVREKYYREKAQVPGTIENLMTAVNRQYPPGGSKDGVVETILREGLRHPLGAAGLAGWKAARCWYATDSQRHDRLAAVLQAPYLVLLTLSFATAFRMVGPPRLLALLAVTLLCYFWVVTIAVLSIVRYMVPAVVVAFLVVPAVFTQRSTDTKTVSVETIT